MLITVGDMAAEVDINEESGKALERLLGLYKRHFDISFNCTLLDTTVPVMAHFNSRGEKFLLVKKAKIWAYECNEHVFFFAPEVADERFFCSITDFVEASEALLVKPHSEHMYTYLTAIVITERLTKEARKNAKRYKWRKSYRFSLYGWCHIRIVIFELPEGTFTSNRDGKEVSKALSAIYGI